MVGSSRRSRVQDRVDANIPIYHDGDATGCLIGRKSTAPLVQNERNHFIGKKKKKKKGPESYIIILLRVCCAMIRML